MAPKPLQRMAKRCGRAKKGRKDGQIIWLLALPQDSVLTKSKPYVQVPAILRTDRQTRHEAFSIWFTSWRIKIDVVDCDSAFSMISTTCYSVLFDHAYQSGLVSHKDAHLITPPEIVFRGSPEWGNFFRFLAELHENDYDRAQAGADPGRGNGEIIDSAMCIVARMRKRPWNEVEEVLEMFHRAIAAKDAAWV
ncbi:hypothetical protein LTR78_003904 [Recurvomyces mirabilis]|uniref:Uncharacterized protein n=1 Tax=Recurvomyces mirabilis TaxID=574656 RepID=A0AAE1C321_9PEZI|nr:hypothetical protein LTR78_003904 [Recurvomyces mirabilis]KAK5153957.1 hypothetical protein LTS14_007177 [Recurvomyces mirabilis]